VEARRWRNVRHGAESTIEPTTIDAQSWVAFPITLLTPSAPDQQKWLVILAGIAVSELRAATAERRQQLS
jgi:hypothetical protein